MTEQIFMKLSDKYSSIMRDGDRIILVRKKKRSLRLVPKKVVVDMSPPKVRGDPELAKFITQELKKFTQQLVETLRIDLEKDELEYSQRNRYKTTIMIYPHKSGVCYR